MDVSAPSKKRKAPKGCWLVHWGKSVWQLIRVIIDMPINIPSVLVPLDGDKGMDDEIKTLMNERSTKYKMLTEIGNAYTSLCILSIVLLAVLLIIVYVLKCIDESNRWLIPVMAISVLPLAISPVYWYKKYCLKEYIRDLDDYIHLIELHSSTNINFEYKSTIISEYFLRRHSKKAKIIIDLTPNRKYDRNKKVQQRIVNI